ncbi:LOW QUALITY PROTEIN: hypothetical protein DAPPUDRAFT_234827 [Daphnia pulex]|uniref:Uncharacterized protein n=1 Tax=Daphnia pulex TaxID=6669 RepID=E9FXI5_DAPPU|nr:LOW QUALITY PROTEIN: hypothetical protein DAPPUDRAFT_234827 [Daphnia pulex]|eukprot:EFX88260.1 LOW QUALITY PROTEIN: hypothetical protein DAPPUDRAFT_234827 [Daphnia pulex]
MYRDKATCRQVDQFGQTGCSSRLKVTRNITPIPNNVPCRRKGQFAFQSKVMEIIKRKGDRGISRVRISDTATAVCSALPVTNCILRGIITSQSWSQTEKFDVHAWRSQETFRETGMLWCRVNYVVVLMLGNVSARSTTGVLMSSGYGGYETATPHVTTPRPLSTTLPSLQIITPLLRCPELLHRIPEISSSPSYAIKGSSTTPRPLITTPLQIMVNYGVVLVLGDVLARSTTGVLMSPGYGGYQTTTPVSDCTTTTYATTSYYTAKCPDYYTTPYALPNYLRQIPERVDYSAEVPKYYTTKAPEYCTTSYHGLVEIKGERNKQSCDVRVASKYFTTKAPECYTTTDVAPSYYTKASDRPLGYQITTPPSYYATTTYDTTSYYTEAPKYYTTKEPEYYTTTNAAPAYYTEAPKYYSAPSYYTEVPAYYTTKTVEYYTEVIMGAESLMAGFTTGVPKSPGYGGYQTTTPASDCTTTTYATTSYYTEASKYYTTNYYSAPSYTTLTEAVKYYVASTFYPTATPSYYAEPKYYTEAPVYYTTTYATLCYYNTEALK